MMADEKNSILIVDDEKANLLFLNHILGDEYAIYMARDAEEAIKRADEYQPDLILLDIILPGMNGYQACSALKASEKTKDIPVIFITGLNSIEDEMKGLGLGAVDYINKPFNPQIVKLRVRNQMTIRNQTRLIIDREIAERSSRAKSEFLSRMSHEMRTPMNAIISMSNLARSTEDPVKRDNYLVKVRSASHNLLKMIDDVLEISDIEEGKINLVRSERHLSAILRKICDEQSELMKDERQTLKTDIDPSIPEILLFDETRLTQVIVNLLSNASKFTGENGVIRLRAMVKDTAHDQLTLQIDVADTGIGISAEQQKTLFKAFEQVDGSISRKYGGAGLGLYISKSIVEMMGGDIWVNSEAGQGSTFSFTFTAKVKTPEAADGAPLSFHGKTALLVEDVEINREIVMAMLEDTRLHIVCAANGLEAVDLFTSEPAKFDVIFMDINMPEMDGVEATRRIRAHGTPEGAQIPIIAMTANILPNEVKSYFAAGMTDHIGKPLDFDKLLSMIGRYLQ